MTMDDLEKAVKRLEKIYEKAADRRPPPRPEHSICPSLAYRPARLQRSPARPPFRRPSVSFRTPSARAVSFEEEGVDEYEGDSQELYEEEYLARSPARPPFRRPSVSFRTPSARAVSFEEEGVDEYEEDSQELYEEEYLAVDSARGPSSLPPLVTNPAKPLAWQGNTQARLRTRERRARSPAPSASGPAGPPAGITPTPPAALAAGGPVDTPPLQQPSPSNL
ncbi:uncharacterized protein LOC107046897, partial [Diachasma alloeum]|uniref:uncharacterized protein LOC107046897 n=1 Tax=Diachasma alloeum TaxID=454923 RepID=UPI0007383087